MAYHLLQVCKAISTWWMTHQKSSTSQLHFYELDVFFQGSHDGMIVVTYVVFLNSLVFRYVCNCMALLIVALIAACVE